MDTAFLDDLEKRIAAMEEKVLPKNGDDKQLMQSLLDVNTTLTTFAAKRERFNQIFKRVPAIAEYLSPGFCDTVGMDKTYEKQIILSSEEDVVSIGRQFAEIKKLESALNSEKIREVPSHENKLSKLELIQQTQLEELSTISLDLNDLLLKYNELVSVLSQNFVNWDWALCQLEEKKQVEI